MKDFIKISDVAEALGVPASTLRYWDKAGLIHFDRDYENNYRQFSFRTMLDICNIMLFRSLELPLPIIKQIETFNSTEMSTLLSATQLELTQKIAHYQKVIARIEQRKYRLTQFQELKTKPLTIIRYALPPVYDFDFNHHAMVQYYLQDPSHSADLLFDTVKADGEKQGEFQCGIFIDKEQNQNGEHDFAALLENTTLLRPADQNRRPYLYGLLWMDRHGESNVAEFREKAQQQGYQSGTMICKYLTATCEDSITYHEYFEAWLELS